MNIKDLLDQRTEIITQTGCWNYNGGIGSSGYGQIMINGRLYVTHRLSAKIFLNFDIDSKLQVLHKCDNRKCWNPDHLFIGTHQDNMQDKVNKGRCIVGNTDVLYCIHGHEFTKENTITKIESGYTHRRCRKCAELRNKRESKKRTQAKLEQKRGTNL